MWQPDAQTSGVAEVHAFGWVMQLMCGPAVIFTDYQALVQGASRSLHWRIKHPSRNGAIYRQVAGSANYKLLEGVTKVKAHLTIESETTEELKRHIRANAKADELAKEAALRHRRTQEQNWAVKELDNLICEVSEVCEFAAALLPLWGKAGKHARIPVEERVRLPRAAVVTRQWEAIEDAIW